MNRIDRNLLAKNLRHYLSGTITNFEFMDRIDPVYSSKDRGVRVVENAFWYCYDDLREHRNAGKDKLSKETKNQIIRAILFLKSDNEYEWEEPRYPNPITWIRNLLSVNIFNENFQDKDISVIGDEHVWPFFQEAQFNKEIKEPKYMNKKTTLKK